MIQQSWMKLNNMTKRLADLQLIDKRTLYQLQCRTATCPRIYGQPKAHKSLPPLCPIVLSIAAYTYQMSKFIANTLQTTFNSRYNIGDSYTFVKYVKSITIPPAHVMVSFDVVSLFISIPKDTIIRSMGRWTDIKQGAKINLDKLFLEILEM